MRLKRKAGHSSDCCTDYGISLSSTSLTYKAIIEEYRGRDIQKTKGFTEVK